jgi:hypothetical protein
MCFREITCCDPAILSIMFVHGEDMQLFDIHGKEGVDMIVQMDAIECKKAGSDSLLAARTTLSTAVPVCTENSDSHVVVVAFSVASRRSNLSDIAQVHDRPLRRSRRKGLGRRDVRRAENDQSTSAQGFYAC